MSSNISEKSKLNGYSVCGGYSELVNLSEQKLLSKAGEEAPKSFRFGLGGLLGCRPLPD